MEQEQLVSLIAACRRGDRAAQERLIAESQDRVYYHCLKMLGDPDDAMDAAQDVLVAVLTNMDKLKEPAAYWGWVNSITANRCKRMLAAPHKEWQVPEDDEGNSMLDTLEDLDDQVVPDKALDNDETRRLVMGLIDALPPDQKICVLYYYYDEMTVAQIAQALNVPEGTVKSRLNYARKSIKAGAEELERKGAKLYGISPAALLLYFLRKDAAASALSPGAAGTLTASALGAQAAASGGAAGTAAASGGAAAASAAAVGAGGAAKLGLGIGGAILALAGMAAAGVVVGGGVFVATHPEVLPHPAQPTEQVWQLPDPGKDATDPLVVPLPTEDPQPDIPPASEWADAMRLELSRIDVQYGLNYARIMDVDGDGADDILVAWTVDSEYTWNQHFTALLWRETGVEERCMSATAIPGLDDYDYVLRRKSDGRIFIGHLATTDEINYRVEGPDTVARALRVYLWDEAESGGPMGREHYIYDERPKVPVNFGWQYDWSGMRQVSEEEFHAFEDEYEQLEEFPCYIDSRGARVGVDETRDTLMGMLG